VDEQNDQIAHRRIVAGREILRNYGRNNNSPETGEEIGVGIPPLKVPKELRNSLVRYRRSCEKLRFDLKLVPLNEKNQLFDPHIWF